jgi:hypothetical protein
VMRRNDHDVTIFLNNYKRNKKNGLHPPAANIMLFALMNLEHNTFQ